MVYSAGMQWVRTIRDHREVAQGHAGRRRRLPETAVAALVTIAAALALMAAGCGTDDGGTSSSTPAATGAAGTATASPTDTASSPADTTTVNVYFLRDGMIGVAQRTLPATTMPATAAMNALLEGPDRPERKAGLTTAIPTQYELDSVSIKDGTAFVDLTSTAVVDQTAAGARRLLAQIVYTITQFATVDGAVVTLDGDQLLPSGETGTMERLLTRADFDDVTPYIFVESPALGQSATEPLAISGTANTFEATFVAEVVDDSGVKLGSTVVTATSGSGTRGTFSDSVEFELPAVISGGDESVASVTLVVYEESAEDGSRLHEVRIPLQVVVD